ncbi:hypothetical protein, partial [Stenotrophomonas geniculata]|uniref:hypothetical protein n=1 Tax=Stenotrophomonas geniculata TaxID=86188 RepID=UPI002E78C97A
MDGAIEPPRPGSRRGRAPPPRPPATHNDSEGKKATTSSTASAANQNGQIVRMLWPTLILPMAVPMN